MVTFSPRPGVNAFTPRPAACPSPPPATTGVPAGTGSQRRGIFIHGANHAPRSHGHRQLHGLHLKLIFYTMLAEVVHFQ